MPTLNDNQILSTGASETKLDSSVGTPLLYNEQNAPASVTAAFSSDTPTSYTLTLTSSAVLGSSTPLTAGGAVPATVASAGAAPGPQVDGDDSTALTAAAALQQFVGEPLHIDQTGPYSLFDIESGAAISSPVTAPAAGATPLIGSDHGAAATSAAGNIEMAPDPGMPETAPATSAFAYPYDCVCYITTVIDGETFQGSGVIIGPHTVLTASHVLWSEDDGVGASSISVYPGYEAGGQAITGIWSDHYYEVDNAGDELTQAASQDDFAIIDFASSLSSYGSFGVTTGFGGGTVHLTGYPADFNGDQTDDVGTVSADPNYAVLDYGTVSSSPGNSGGPLWVNDGTTQSPDPQVVGVVSTSGWAVQLTSTDWSTIEGWEADDAHLWPTPPTVQVQNVSVSENASIAASAMITGVTNPSGDNITAYEFIDEGGDGGHFTVNGVVQADNQRIEVLTGNLSSISYVGGPSVGSETLEVGVYDATTNSYSNYSTLTATTTAPHVAPTISVRNVSVSENASIAASAMITGVSNPSGDNITAYEFIDEGGDGGHFVVNGVVQADNQRIEVLSNNLSSISYVGGPSAVSETLEVGVYDATTNTYSNYSTLTATTTPPGSTPNDFNGDGVPDILYENLMTGDTGWNDGPATAWHDLGAAPKSYNVVGVADFNGDGKSDILWSNPASGDIGWNDGPSTAWHDLGNAPTSYHVVGTADFNGDGTVDILWENPTSGDTGWNDGPNTAWHDLGTAPTSYSVIGVADFNGDGSPDILWENLTSGDIGWNDGPSTPWHDLGTAPTSYHVVGIADFNGDGQTDLLWSNPTSGDIGWNDGPNTTWHDLGTAPTSYNVVGVADYNGDGKPDILWQNPTSGDIGWNDGPSTTWHDLGTGPTSYSVIHFV